MFSITPPNDRELLDFVIRSCIVDFVKTAYSVIVEIVKIVAATCFLTYISGSYLSPTRRVTRLEIEEIVIIGPVLEEFLIRGLLQRGIGLGQKYWNEYVLKRELTSNEIKVQTLFRIQLSAIIFAALHLLNPHETRTNAMIQLTWSYIGGMVCGLTSEKYGTLSISIIAHGLNNGI